jgi:hypothetical protein
MTSRSLFLLKKREDYNQGDYSSGNHIATGMWNSAMFVVEQLQAAGREAMAVIVTDGNDIDREVTAYNPTHVFIEGLWVTPAKFDELLAIPRHQNRTWAVRIHSDIPFLATEGIAMERIVAYMQQGVVVAPNAQRAHADLKWLQSMIGAPETSLVYLPNCYPTDFMPLYKGPSQSFFQSTPELVWTFPNPFPGASLTGLVNGQEVQLEVYESSIVVQFD